VKRSIKKILKEVPARIERGLFFMAGRRMAAGKTRACHSGTPSGVWHLPLVLPEG
jgi:hypothetical protein